jgi:hypothetical protein
VTYSEEIKVEAYRRSIATEENIIKTYEDMILTRDAVIKYPTLVEYKKAIVKIVRLLELIREITGEEEQS